jgi:hypothetical protein
MFASLLFGLWTYCPVLQCGRRATSQKLTRDRTAVLSWISETGTALVQKFGPLKMSPEIIGVIALWLGTFGPFVVTALTHLVSRKG